MATPADLQALIDALPWTNGMEELSGAEMEALWNECVQVFETDTGTPGGTNGQLQYNNAGSFGGYGIGSGLSVVGGNLTATAGTGLTVINSLAALVALVGTSGQVVYLDAGGQLWPFCMVNRQSLDRRRQ